MGKGKGKKQKTPPKDEAAEKRRLEEEMAGEEENDLEFQKAVLEIRVKELEQLKVGMQRKCEYLETQVELFKTQFEEMKEEKDDIIAHLSRVNSEGKTTIKELEDRLYGTQKAREDEATDFLQQLAEKDRQRKEVEENTEKCFAELNAKLATLEDFALQRETLFEEKYTLKKTLDSERKSYQMSYDHLENKTIMYKDKLRREAIEMLVQMSKDVHKAGKLCLTATVKSAINSNVKLQNELEITNRDNISLRKRIEKLEDLLREKRMTIEVIEEENTMAQKRCLEYKDITVKLINRQLEMEAEVNEMKVFQKELVKLQETHSLCRTDEEIQMIVAEEVEKFMERDREKEKHDDRMKPEEVKELEDELVRCREIIVKLAITAKNLSQTTTDEEKNYLKEELKIFLMRTYAIALKIPGLPPEVRAMLTLNFPDVTPALGTVGN